LPTAETVEKQPASRNSQLGWPTARSRTVKPYASTAAATLAHLPLVVTARLEAEVELRVLEPQMRAPLPATSVRLPASAASALARR